jgi:hypothetical protein
MTPKAILAQCQSLTAVISDLGFKRPEVSAFINFYAGEDFSVTVSMRVGGDWNSSVSQSFHGQDFAELLNQACAWVYAQKTPEEIRKEKFIAQLGRVIDEGKEIGFEVEFMNPLIETMQRLSENVLELHRAA